MKLLYVTPFIEGAGGVQRVLSLKTNYLIEKWNYEISILATNSKTDQKHYEFNKKINFYSEIASGQGFFYLYNFSLILKKHIGIIKPDIIIVCDNGYKGYLTSFLISKKHKIIFECHGALYFDEIKNKIFRNIVLYFSYKFYNICASKFSKFVILVDDFKKDFKTNNLIVIPNPIWFSTTKTPNYQAKKVIAVGRHSHQKGFDTMLFIWQKVVKKHPDWLLEIYGESNRSIDLEALSSSLGINKNVNFFNPVTNIDQKYLNASLFILTSRYEGFGMVLLEAMAAGLPCISFDCKFGPKDIITNKTDGFLIENGNKEAFVDAINLLIENEELKIELGKKAKINSEKYNIDKVMNQWKELFLTLKYKNQL